MLGHINCIISAPRTGSNKFCEVISGVKTVDGYYEIFHELDAYGINNNVISFINKKMNTSFENTVDEDFGIFRRSQPDVFLELLNKYLLEENKKHLFFKLFFNQLPEEALEKLFKVKKISFIFLVRNILDIYISQVKASDLSSWDSVDTTQIKINLDRKKFLTYQDRILNWYSYCYSKINNKSTIKFINYENIFSNGDVDKNILSSVGLNKEKSIIKEPFFVKQDKNIDWFDKVKNPDTVLGLLNENKIIVDIQKYIEDKFKMGV